MQHKIRKMTTSMQTFHLNKPKRPPVPRTPNGHASNAPPQETFSVFIIPQKPPDVYREALIIYNISWSTGSEITF